MAYVSVADQGVSTDATARNGTQGTSQDGSGWVINFSGQQSGIAPEKTQKDTYGALGDTNIPAGTGNNLLILAGIAAVVLIVVLRRRHQRG